MKIRGHRIELGEIETELRAQREVREAVCVARVGESGPRLIGYVVAHDEALACVPAQSQESPTVLVEQWESVFDSAHASASTAPDFRSWISSVTDEPIPVDQMQEWLAATVGRISELGPTTIFEIGCGVGLLVQQIAPKVTRYLATDFSAGAVRDLRRWMQTQPSLSHVRVHQAEATDFSFVAGDSFDTVVINSVAQYFPSADYLLEVLRGAAGLVGPHGQIFVGDVRHLGHLQMFHTSVQLAKAPGTITVRQLKDRVRRAVAQDKELVLDPAFFHAVAGSVGMHGVEINIRRGRADNELTRYRYDVVFRAQPRVGPQAESFDLDRDLHRGFLRLEEHLRIRRPVALHLQCLPNLRMAHDLAAWRLLQSSDESLTVAELRTNLRDTIAVGVDPESLWELGERHGYDVSIRWSDGTLDGALDIEFVARSCESREVFVAQHETELPAQWRSFASEPNRFARTRALQTLLRERLRHTLPEYMVPSAVVVLDAMPLNTNGKLDRKALPEPEFESTGRFESPVGEAEQALARVWSDVLGIGRVGRHDNLFEAGGDSILSLQIVSRLRGAGWKVTPRDMFERQTIAQLAGVAVPIAPTIIVSDSAPDREMPLLPIQAWFFEQHIPRRHYWNRTLLLQPREALEAETLARALNAVIRHHDAFRLCFTWSDARGVEACHAEEASSSDVLWTREAAGPSEVEAIGIEAQSSLDLTNGPVCRAVLIQLAGGGQRLLWAIHHLVVDAVSWRVLLEDLQTAYRRARAGAAICLPANTTSFQTWSRELRRPATDLEPEMSYWERLADTPVRLPCDNPDSSPALDAQATISVQLDRAQTRTLLRDVPKAYRTQINDVLLTAVAARSVRGVARTRPHRRRRSWPRRHRRRCRSVPHGAGGSLKPLSRRAGSRR